MQTDEWIWGKEKIVWGFDPSHQYTLKVLAPKKGRDGCLSLQYHNHKSETWIQYQGLGWALVCIDGIVCTKVLAKGDILNLPTGTIHRLMGVSEDCLVIEPSTPDAHAADKSQPKDVIRLHCVLGRECEKGRDPAEEHLITEAIRVTEDACEAIARGEMPKEENAEKFKLFGIGRVE